MEPMLTKARAVLSITDEVDSDLSDGHTPSNVKSNNF